MPTENLPAAPSAALLACYNAVPNVVWSVLSLAPISVFCYQHLTRPWLGGLLAVSLLAYALPVRWFRYWQLSPTAATYRQLGVPVLNRFTQHGHIINRLIRRRYPTYRHVRAGRSLVALVRNSYQLERFHLALLLFFLLVSAGAVGQGYWWWALLFTSTNVVYNLYPMWLQQYIRVRLQVLRTE